MHLVRLITSNSVYAIGQHLPVPPGYSVEPFLIASIEQIDEIVTTDEEEEVSQYIRFVCLPDVDSAEKGPGEEPVRPKPADFDDRHDYDLAFAAYVQDLAGYMAQKKYCEQAWKADQDKIAFVAKIPVTDDIRFEYLIMQSELEQQAAGQEPETEVDSESEVSNGNGG